MNELNIVFNWEKPKSLPYPKVWKEFQVTRKTGETLDIVIQDIPEDRFEDVIEFLSAYYFDDEPLCDSSNILSDGLSMMIYQYFFKIVLQQKLSLAAFVKNKNGSKPEMIAGVLNLIVHSKSDPPLPQIAEGTISKMQDIYYAVRRKVNIFELFEADEYLHDWGLCVARAFRGLNIGYHLFTTLPELSSSVRVKGAMMVFTSKYSQAIAEKCGFNVYNEIVYNDYRDVNNLPIFPIVHTKSLKLMGINYSTTAAQ